MSNDKIQAVGVNIAEKATMIWNVADMLRGPFKPHEYGLVILPMTVVKRFHDCLLPSHEAVLAQYEKVKKLAVIDGFLTKASGYQFYNTSKFTFEKLLADPDNIEANFRDYLAGFSPNVQDVLSKFDFDNIIKRMVESNTLYLVIKEFATPKGYLGPDKISAVDCGYIFEDLVKRFSEYKILLMGKPHIYTNIFLVSPNCRSCYMEASSQIQNLLVSVIVASVWQLFSLFDFGPSWSEVGTTDGNGGNYLIAVIHRGQKFKETMEAFQQKRVEFIAQEIRNFDAETLYVFLEWIRGNGHKLDRIIGMAV